MMKRIEVFLPPADEMLLHRRVTPSMKCSGREKGTVRHCDNSLAQEHNIYTLFQNSSQFVIFQVVCMLISPLCLVHIYKIEKNHEVKIGQKGLSNMETKKNELSAMYAGPWHD